MQKSEEGKEQIQTFQLAEKDLPLYGNRFFNSDTDIEYAGVFPQIKF